MLKNSTLHFSDMLIIYSFRFLLVFLVALTEESVLVILCEGVEHLYVKKSVVPVSSPEVVSLNV